MLSLADAANAQTANINGSVRIGPFPSPGTQPCTGTVTFTAEPVSLTGNTGRDTTFSFGGSYSVRPTSVGPNEFWCFVRKSSGNVRLGRWRVSAQLPTWGTNCTVDLHSGNNNLNYTRFRSGCRTGLTFP